MILRKRPLCHCTPAGNLTAPFPSGRCIILHRLHQLTRYARLWRIGLARTKAHFLWDSARAHALSPILTSHSTRKRAQVFEVLVLYSMDVTEAAERFSKASEREKKGDARTYKPIEVFRCLLVMTIGKKNQYVPRPHSTLINIFPA